MAYWLIKSEPSTYSFDDLLRDKKTRWDGVRNFLARNHLRTMKSGDLALFYHSNLGKEVVGIAEVIREAYPDPTAKDGDWSAVDVKPVSQFKQPVTLEAIKSEVKLKTLPLIKQSRLSVMPVESAHFDLICRMGS